MDYIELIMKWLVAPIVGAIWWLFKRVQQSEQKSSEINTELKILEAKVEAQAIASRANHDNLRETLSQVLARLDSIDRYLRKDKRDD